MIPQNNALSELRLEEQPSLTYQMDRGRERIVTMCDNLDAVQQAIYKILNTERYNCPLYSWNYGIELQDLIGRPTNYCSLELERRITEALIQDDRIERVSDFQFEYPQKGIILVSFTVSTTKGILTMQKEVSI